MEDKILNILKLNRSGALSLEVIYKRLGFSDLSYNDFLDIIDDLKKEKKIYCVNSANDLFTLNPFKEGIYHILRSGKCFVTIDDVEYDVINPRNLDCMEGDKVLVRITDFSLLKASIKEIIDRSGIIAEVKTINNTRFAVVDKETRYKIKLDDSIVDGMLIGIKVDTVKSGNFYHATLDRVICHKNAPRVDERKILYANGFECDFSEKVLEELKNVPTEVLDSEIKVRRDLRDKLIFTIDGDDTKDIDDAISLDILENGNYLLGVHIADVSHYVKENSNIDLEARLRATSVYMPGVVNPMYDPQLSNGICSLNPNVDRLALSCEMEINKNGDLVNFDIFKSVIHSRIQMTYKKVNSILEDGIIPEGYYEYADVLKRMKSLANIVRKSRVERGMLNFESSEVKFVMDDNGKVLDIVSRNQGAGEEMIEDFMLQANECVATYVYNMGLNFIYRVHDVPNEEKLINSIKIIKNYGEKIKTKLNINDPKIIQKILSDLSKSDNYDIYSNMILRCMAKASYKTSNFGHFGIGVKAYKNEAYTHFTSPIRRYPDTMVHRMLTMILNGDLDRIASDGFKEMLDEISKHSSEMELLADACEREANKMNMASYMKDYIGACFKGKIVGFTNHGMFVKLDNFVEGRVAYSTMDDFYRYDPEFEIIVGDRKKKIYRLGDKVYIKVVKADRDEREIDFELVDKVKGDNFGNIK